MSDDDLDSKIQPREASSEELDLESELAGTQAAFYSFLKKEDTDGERGSQKMLAPIYIGGLYALKHKKNHFRFSLAAHSFRELIEKCYGGKPQTLMMSLPRQN